jgi:hypothetical protein
MTVLELIEELEKVEDKSKVVLVDYYDPIDYVEDSSIVSLLTPL